MRQTLARRQRIVAVVAITVIGGIPALAGTAHARGRDSVSADRLAATIGLPPGECPPGFSPARPPLNPALGCLPDFITLPLPPDFGPPDPGSCPPGFRPARPPINPALGCLPDFITAPSSRG